MARVGLTADRLATAGAELADRIGFDEVTVAELARQFGVQPASVYSHVESCSDLKQRITLLSLAEMDECVADAVVGRAGKDALVALAEAYRGFAHAHPGRFSASQHPLGADAATEEASLRQAQRLHAILRGYPLTEADAGHAIRLLGSTIQGFVSQELNGNFGSNSPSIEESWSRIVDALDTVLSSWPKRAA